MGERRLRASFWKELKESEPKANSAIGVFLQTSTQRFLLSADLQFLKQTFVLQPAFDLILSDFFHSLSTINPFSFFKFFILSSI